MRYLIRGLIAAVLLAALPVITDAAVFVGVSVNIAPPVLPVYVQPPCPEAGYMWVPGYWAWGDDDYYWVPGTWALAPTPGLLWTPGYWGWGEGVYLWHAGYWGPHVGFYGGINYGYGYGGAGFEGGEWRGREFYYNRSVTNVTNVTNITNVYNRTVVNNVTVNHTAFNGGEGGVQARATAAETRAAQEHHVEATPLQREHEQKAQGDRSLRASVNGGHPAIAATQKPAAFTGKGVVAARGASPAAHAAAATNHADRPQSHAASGSGGEHAAAARTDRPPGAQHTAGGSGAEHAAAARTDRPPGAQHTAGGSGAEHAAAARTDRPPGAQHTASGSGAEHAAAARADRPPAAQHAASGAEHAAAGRVDRPPQTPHPAQGPQVHEHAGAAAPNRPPSPAAAHPQNHVPASAPPQGGGHEHGSGQRPEGERQDHGGRR